MRAASLAPNGRTKKEEMVLQLVFREPAEIVHATTTPFGNPHRIQVPIHAQNVLHNRPTGTTVPILREFTLHSFVSWAARFQVRSVGTAVEAVGEGIVCRFRRAPYQNRLHTEPRSWAIKQQ